MTLNNTLRIIGGRWRGRKLVFPTHSPIRPTLDRIRETLFNWLQPSIHGARCLDAFAGSGALGIEALSRGAAHVTFIDRDPQALIYIKQHLNVFEAKNYQCQQFNMPQDITHFTTEPYDIIFLDPPFQGELLSLMLGTLRTSPLVKPNTLIYFETHAHETFLDTASWHLLRHKQTKHIAYGLLQKTIANEPI